MTTLNVAGWQARSLVNGPGARFVLWLQGCGLGCPGCWNPETWSFAPRRLMSVEHLLELLDAAPGVEGITLSGGEPLAQAAALLPFLQAVRARGLSVMIFTGHERSELRSEAVRAVLALTDVLVSGRYVEAERSLLLRWRGSRNQRIDHLTERYRSLGDGEEAIVEVLLDGEGGAQLTGFPPDELLAALR